MCEKNNTAISVVLYAGLLFISGCVYTTTTQDTTQSETIPYEPQSTESVTSASTHPAGSHSTMSHEKQTETHGSQTLSITHGVQGALGDQLLAHAAVLDINCSNGWHEELKDPPTLSTNGTRLDSVLVAAPLYKCIGGKKVLLQSYLDLLTGFDERPVGPAYVMRATQKSESLLNLNFTNALGPRDGSYYCDDHAGDVSKCTNLHTHGFHVSPSNPADNVFLHLSPADPSHQYQFKLPPHQAPGTHWLHAHLHGSTAPQLKNGMAGALILIGETDDRLAAEYGIGGDKDKIMLLQQLTGDDDKPLCFKGINQTYKTSVNGQCLPKITVQAGEAFHWRLIHAGISGTINFVISHPDGRPVRLMEYARDGITMNGAISRDSIMLQPGYRSDVLFKMPQCPNNQYPCTFKVTDGASAANFSLFGLAEEAEPIAEIRVTGLASQPMRLPPSNWAQFKSPYEFIPDSELLIDRTTGKPVENKIWFASINGEQTVNDAVFPDGSTTELKLNTASLWKIWVGKKQTDDTISHPFHIHVNPFQVTDYDANGRPFNYWKDTILISGTDNKGEENAITVRSRYENFDGEFVLHCHNLNHEDKGMMKKVRISR